MTLSADTRQRLLRALITAQHVSGCFIGVFVIVHLAAPIVAIVGGSSLSSRTMLLGREYYQGPISEKLLVYAPAAIHLASGMAKHLLEGLHHPPSLLSMTAFPILIFLPLHYATHRLYPSISEPPILSLGPRELDYEYVKHGLEKWPIHNAIIYVGLTCAVVAHGVEGTALMLRVWITSSGKRRWDWKKMGIWMAISGSVVVGLWTIWNEPALASRQLAKRIDAAWGHAQGLFNPVCDHEFLYG